MRRWGAAGLPSMEHAMQSGLAVTYAADGTSRASKWPLLIDPQRQGARWVKAMFQGDLGLVVVKLSDESLPVVSAIGAHALIQSYEDTSTSS